MGMLQLPPKEPRTSRFACAKEENKGVLADSSRYCGEQGPVARAVAYTVLLRVPSGY
ncbi:hypothetical protein [Streptomyces sp. NPDC002769]|uniref:hypothetical protein n=1 Tax=Streptomyces sp. NPDC002769 TaxID=3154542 RepID=UPI0033311310